jgi:ABC-type transport system involved in multi-copper enzyme maturation permease subunit
MAAQMLTVYVLTPIFAAGTIAGERERGTLDHLLVTHLHDREIVLGKLASRLASLTLLVLAGLPVLGLMLFLGGVDPNLVIAGFVATLATMASIGSLGVLNSIHSASTREAAFFTYLEIIGYLVLTIPCVGCAPLGDLPAAGNILVAGYEYFGNRGQGGTWLELSWITVRYVAFHALVAGLCCIWAEHRLRGEFIRPPIFLRRNSPARKSQAKRPIGAVLLEPTPIAKEAKPSRTHHVVMRPEFYREGSAPLRRPRPRPTDQPLFWKELYVEKLFPRLLPGMLLPAILMLCVLLIAITACLTPALAALAGKGSRLPGESFVPFVATAVACGLLLVVGARAAASFSRERERQTLDSLLATPLDTRDILNAKWLGSVLSVRKGWWALAAIWGLGVLSGGIHPLAVFPLAAAWIAYALFVAGVGIWFSLNCRNTLRATIGTLLVACGVNVLPWVAGLCWDALAYAFDFRHNAFADFATLIASPPATMRYFASSGDDLDIIRRLLNRSPVELFGASLLGILVYAIAARVLWWRINARFGRLTGRMPV